jgi:hypothetical protein
MEPMSLKLMHQQRDLRFATNNVNWIRSAEGASEDS